MLIRIAPDINNEYAVTWILSYRCCDSSFVKDMTDKAPSDADVIAFNSPKPNPNDVYSLLLRIDNVQPSKAIIAPIV